ncbi:PREDICTED: mediator of RNA polymerase II transcription subunit 27 isoform X3 [Galeopterus variegatus]|uniref:Mediator of RNA polymerase II transcription subunit 27 n=1 Tax=Galeopterus variegatus TaxID=482537 RepID=A0ABM0R7R0_GALVR|nr:PREDICTED: mediator of RNA polymerase II transcription subunit 27 isoform X3 [Galeopterus variegatus]
MADVLSVGVNLEAFSQAISAIQALRSSVSRVFDCLKDGMRNKETLEGREKAFVAHFQDNLNSVNRDLNELERLSNLVGKPSENHPLHNSGLLSLDPVQDKTPLYSQLLQAYKWSNKLQYHAGLASGLLNQQSLKRSANQMGVSAKRRPKAQPTTLVLPPQDRSHHRTLQTIALSHIFLLILTLVPLLIPCHRRLIEMLASGSYH